MNSTAIFSTFSIKTQNALQTSRTSEVSQVRKVGLRRRGARSRWTEMAQDVL